jgi:hypothetical protein
MTICNYFRRHVLIGYGLAFLGVGISMASTFLTDGRDKELGFFLFGFVPFLAGVVFITSSIWCRRCRGNLALTPAAYPTFSRKYRLNFCPYCGVCVDENI